MGKAWLRILLGGVIGLLVGLGVLRMVYLALIAVQWRELPPTVSPVTELAVRGGGCGYGTVYVKVADGSLRQLSRDEPKRWLPVPSEPEWWRFFRLTKPCEFSSEAFSVLSFRPTDVSACFRGGWGGPDLGVEENYILDSRGILWQWHRVEVCGVLDHGPDLTTPFVVIVVLLGCTYAGAILAAWSLRLSLLKKIRQRHLPYWFGAGGGTRK